MTVHSIANHLFLGNKKSNISKKRSIAARPPHFSQEGPDTARAVGVRRACPWQALAVERGRTPEHGPSPRRAHSRLFWRRQEDSGHGVRLRGEEARAIPPHARRAMARELEAKLKQAQTGSEKLAVAMVQSLLAA